jgi:hypothetical protein
MEVDIRTVQWFTPSDTALFVQFHIEIILMFSQYLYQQADLF